MLLGSGVSGGKNVFVASALRGSPAIGGNQDPEPPKPLN